MNKVYFAYEMPRIKSADTIGGLVPTRSAPVSI